MPTPEYYGNTTLPEENQNQPSKSPKRDEDGDTIIELFSDEEASHAPPAPTPSNQQRKQVEEEEDSIILELESEGTEPLVTSPSNLRSSPPPASSPTPTRTTSPPPPSSSPTSAPHPHIPNHSDAQGQADEEMEEQDRIIIDFDESEQPRTPSHPIVPFNQQDKLPKPQVSAEKEEEGNAMEDNDPPPPLHSENTAEPP